MDSRNFFAGCAAYHFMSESKRLCLRTKFLRLKMVHGRAAQPKKRVSSRFEYAGTMSRMYSRQHRRGKLGYVIRVKQTLLHNLVNPIFTDIDKF